jgi:2-iminoacetate synthase ThiH
MSLTKQQALEMFRSDDLIGIGMEADAVRRKLHPEGTVTYIIDRNINYTNFCTEYCTFCAFYRPLKRAGGAKKGTSSISTPSTKRFARPWNSAARAC